MGHPRHIRTRRAARRFAGPEPGQRQQVTAPAPAATTRGGRARGLPEADGVRALRRRPGRRPVRAGRAPVRLPRPTAAPLGGPPGATRAAPRWAAASGGRPRRARRPHRGAVRPGVGAAVVGVLAPVADGLLVGEHANRPDFPPTMFAAEVLAAGGRPWTTLACRDRNRVVLEQELAGLAAVGVDGVLCVTGDGRGPGVRPGVTQVFDLDGTRLAALAAAAGAARRRAGVAGGAAGDAAARRGSRRSSGPAPSCACSTTSAARPGWPSSSPRPGPPGRRCRSSPAVAVYTDERSARVLQRFPGLHLDDDVVERVLGRAGHAARPASRRRSPRRGRCSRCPGWSG